jgi:hypothetical protein
MDRMNERIYDLDFVSYLLLECRGDGDTVLLSDICPPSFRPNALNQYPI